MSVNYTATILDLNSNRYFFINITNEERQTYFHDSIENQNKRVFNAFESALVPVRTDCNHLLEDFLAPTYFHNALNIDLLVGSFFASITAALIDMITLPVRCITVLPRMYDQNHQEEPPILEFLARKGITKNLLTSLEVAHVHVSRYASLTEIADNARTGTDFTLVFKDISYPVNDNIGQAGSTNGRSLLQALRECGALPPRNA